MCIRDRGGDTFPDSKKAGRAAKTAVLPAFSLLLSGSQWGLAPFLLSKGLQQVSRPGFLVLCPIGARLPVKMKIKLPIPCLLYTSNRGLPRPGPEGDDNHADTEGTAQRTVFQGETGRLRHVRGGQAARRGDARLLGALQRKCTTAQEGGGPPRPSGPVSGAGGFHQGRHSQRTAHVLSLIHIYLHAPGGPDCAHGADGQLRAGAKGRHRRGGPDFHARRRVGRPGGRPVDLPGGDERNGRHPQKRHPAQPAQDVYKRQPYHSVDSYIQRLVQKGYKVAICEQLEDPALAKGLVKRDIVRVVTPGTITDEAMLEGSRNNFLAALYCSCLLYTSFQADGRQSKRRRQNARA